MSELLSFFLRSPKMQHKNVTSAFPITLPGSFTIMGLEWLNKMAHEVKGSFTKRLEKLSSVFIVHKGSRAQNPLPFNTHTANIPWRKHSSKLLLRPKSFLKRHCQLYKSRSLP